MGKNWKQWAADKGLNKWFRRDNFIILVLVGILLVIIALPVKNDAGSDEESKTGLDNILVSGKVKDADNEGGVLQDADTDEAYAVYLEGRLTDVLSRMEGVGKVKVMITLKASRELVVEKEEPVSRSTTNEGDSQGGSRIISQMESEENTVYRTEGSVSEPYVIKTLSPQIEGVLVVAEGAGSGNVNLTIVEIVKALFGIEAHKVQVVKMESTRE